MLHQLKIKFTAVHEIGLPTLSLHLRVIIDIYDACQEGYLYGVANKNQNDESAVRVW